MVHWYQAHISWGSSPESSAVSFGEYYCVGWIFIISNLWIAFDQIFLFSYLKFKKTKTIVTSLSQRQLFLVVSVLQSKTKLNQSTYNSYCIAPKISDVHKKHTVAKTPAQQKTHLSHQYTLRFDQFHVFFFCTKHPQWASL